jgi:tetraacyldisaccharide 4'-kinase
MPRSDLPAGPWKPTGSPGSQPGLFPSASPSARQWVVRWWAGGGGTQGRILRLLTLPLEVGFKTGSGILHGLYDRGILPLQRAPVPVISVGNLTVGGSGKTPLSAWLVRGLTERGQRAALVARGYGEDEMALHRRWNPDCLLLAEEDRAYGAWKAARKGATVVVLDDGFQHRRLGRELDLVLVAANTPEKVRLLPRGPFREPFSAVQRAGLVVVTQKGRHASSATAERHLEPFLREPPVRIAFLPDHWTTLDGEPSEAPQGDYLALCGIGDPEGFSAVLRETTGRQGEMLVYPDHHVYSWADLHELQLRLGGRILVTTEKDAVKLAAYRERLEDVRVLHLRVQVLEGEERLWARVEEVLNHPDRGEPA